MKNPYWTLKHEKATYEMLGYIPSFLDTENPASARDQLDQNYRHAGGWTPFAGFKMTETGLKYPGDPEMPLLAETKLREETIRYYECSWVAIVQPDGSYEIARMD
jgi:hypothetical protein